ncbi:hypothetical protein KBY17_27435 [Streptomyces sp. RK75]|nr:hypothetical protein [Streptomyces sp. RK75]
MLTHSPVPVAGDGENEPEPQHERDTSNPDAMPELPRRTSQATSHADLMLDLATRTDTNTVTKPARRTLRDMDPVRAIARATERRQLRRAGVA